MGDVRKVVRVVAAVIIHGGKVFATQRGYGEWKDWWEFPGGKIEGTFVLDDNDCGKWIPAETPQEALKREISEELQTVVEVGDLLTRVEYDYPKFHLSMQCYLCTVVRGELTLQEHEDARWLTREELNTVKWLPADLEILPLLSQKI